MNPITVTALVIVLGYLFVLALPLTFTLLMSGVRVRAAVWLGLNYWTFFVGPKSRRVNRWLDWGMGKPPYIVLHRR